MKPRSLPLLAALLWAGAGYAAEPAAPAAPPPTAPAAADVRGAESAELAGREPIEPNVQHIVIEGESTRVEELRVRGQTQSVVVRHKGAPSYEIVIGDGSRDLSSGAGAQKGAAGQRVWRLLSF